MEFFIHPLISIWRFPQQLQVEEIKVFWVEGKAHGEVSLEKLNIGGKEEHLTQQVLVWSENQKYSYSYFNAGIVINIQNINFCVVKVETNQFLRWLTGILINSAAFNKFMLKHILMIEMWFEGSNVQAT